MTSGEQPVITRVQGGVAHLSLHRPHARNAVTLDMARALHDALSDASVYADLIVLRGSDGHFCAGVDPGDAAAHEAFTGACDLIVELPVPVLAVVEGTATGGGFELVRSADVAIVRDDAVIVDDQARRTPDASRSRRLSDLAGVPRALGHLLTGDRISGRQAADWGLVYRSVPPEGFEQAVTALVATLETQDREVLGRIKHAVRAH